ncbi:MAG: GNAT family N-acetyltransferase [Deltaproteobacteria bacterium]|nr:GNAT family N-acetyltransferase [Deltaproteobacteria bacterium]
MAPSFERIDIASVDMRELDGYLDRNIHQTLPWVNFIAQTQQGEPVLAALKESGETLGYFTGLLVRKFGFCILGSPFPGWSTTYMGFNLKPGVPRSLAAAGLADFAFKALGCHHLELMDRHMTREDYDRLGFETWMFDGYEIDLTQSEDQLFAAMKHACRQAIRKAEKSGVTIEEAHDPEFADDYHNQLKHVFAMHGSVPPFGVERVRSLIRLVHPSGNLLLLRARNADGQCLATSISAGINRHAVSWGAASWRHLAGVRPNEALNWHAVKHWKSRGMTTYDMGGLGEYKEKFGPKRISVPWIHKSRNAQIRFLRVTAESTVRMLQRATGKVARMVELRKQKKASQDNNAA